MSAEPGAVLPAALRSAAGPARLGDELDTRTRSIRGLLVRAGLLYGAIARLPEELSGRDLLDLVERRLPATSVAPDSSSRLGAPMRGRALPPDSPQGSAERTWSGIPAERAPAGAPAGPDASAPREAAGGHGWASAEVTSAGAAPRLAVSTEVRGGHDWPQPGGAEPGGERVRGELADAPLGTTARRDRSTPLAEAVRRYWAGHAATAGALSGGVPLRGGAPEPAPEGPMARGWSAGMAAGGRRTIGIPRLGDPAGRPPIRPGRPAADGARADGRVSIPVAGGSDAGPEIRNILDFGAADGRRELLGSDDLAAQMAEVLREQALRHGIDLT